MHTCANCGAEIDESQEYCDDQCAEEHVGVGENDEEADDGYGE